MSRFAILPAMLVMLPGVAIAQSSDPISVNAQRDRAVVSYADLDLTSASGNRMLERRLNGAIEEVCGSFANVREYSEEDHIIRCRSAARDSIDRQLAARPTDRRVALNIRR